MPLKLGRMTGAEIADWFGISADRFRHNKEKRLAILANYCKFHEEGAKRKTIIIDEIYCDIYQGDEPSLKSYAVPFTRANWNENHLDTVKNLILKNAQSYEANNLHPAANTVRSYTYCAVKDLINYGRARTGRGRSGCYEVIWGKATYENGIAQYAPLSPEEEKIKKEVSKTFYQTKDEELLVEQILEQGSLEHWSNEEINAAIGSYKHSAHEEWKAAVSAALGFQLTAVIKVEWSAFDAE